MLSSVYYIDIFGPTVKISYFEIHYKFLAILQFKQDEDAEIELRWSALGRADQKEYEKDF